MTSYPKPTLPLLPRPHSDAPPPHTELDTSPLRQQINQFNMLVPSGALPGERISDTHNVVDNSIARNDNNHSNDNVDRILYTTDYVDSFRIPHKGRHAECHNIYLKRRCPLTIERNELHKKDDVLGNESISVSMKEEIDECGRSRKAANLHYFCRWNVLEWSRGIWRPMTVQNPIWIILALLTMTLASSVAAPSSDPDSKATRSYLERFGYLPKNRPEVANLVHEGAAEFYEDEQKIAIKTLQEFGGIPVTGVVDDATVDLMKRRRCGRPDVEVDDGRRKKRFAVQGEKWKHTNLTWSLSSSRRPSQLDPHATRAVLARALDVWQQASSLTFQEINSDEADIVVSFAKRYHDDSYPFDGRGSILAHAFFPGSGRGGDAHFDDDELWLLQPRNDDEEGTSLFAVAVHEFGHSLGLSHSSVKGALMFPWYQGIQPNFVLPEDDRNGIQQMYGPKERSVWGKNPYSHPTTTTTTTTTSTTTRRPNHPHHKHRYPNQQPGYTPHPRHPGKYPTYYPQRPSYDSPSYYPERRNGTDEHSRRTTYHHPRPVPETTTHPTTYRPRYPHYRPEYPNVYPRPTEPRTKKPYYPSKTTPRTTTPPPDKPDTCDTNYDAVALIRGELFIFKNRYHWRRGANGRYLGYPMEIQRMWPGLPKNMTHVDAVYERPDRKIAFFIGKELYLFETQSLMPGYPRPLTDLGLPEYLEKLDAAMVWGHNGKTFFFSGTVYWKYDETERRVELDYPRDMSMWKGVGYNIDSVFQWKDGKTYFFKGKGYWKFNDLLMRVEHERQQASAPKWMGCPDVPLGPRAPYYAPPAPGSTLRSFSAASSDRLDHRIYIPVITSLLVLLANVIRCS